jgi:hypothetical protein
MFMDNTITYTVKQGDGYLAIARHIFNSSKRPYVRGLANRYDLMKQVAAKIEVDLVSEYVGFRLKKGQQLKLRTDPGHYIPRLALTADSVAPHVKANKNATAASTKKNRYFVIHSTAGNIKDEDLELRVSGKRKGAAHAYINKEGKIFKIWDYGKPEGWATKAEKYHPELRGTMVHVELVYANNEFPSEKQYTALADIYLKTQKLFKTWLPITGHLEIDRGIKSGHTDPISFDFNHFYSILKTKNVPIDGIEKQSQQRFAISPYCEHLWQWLPTLSGMKFKKVSADVFKSKGCQ